MIGSSDPVASIVLAYFFLNEAVSVLQIAGAILVLAGVVTISLNSAKAKKP